MPKIAAELRPAQIQRLQPKHADRPTFYEVGGIAGLQIQISPSGARSWVLRYSKQGKRRHMGLGPYPEISLAVARERAREARELLRQGRDPIQQRLYERHNAYQEDFFEINFANALKEFTPIKQQALSQTKYSKQWAESVVKYANPTLGELAVSKITSKNVEEVLKPICTEKTATADKLRRKLCEIFDYCKAKGYMTGNNPAEWRANLSSVLPHATKVTKEENYPALRLEDAQRFWSALMLRQGMGAAALRFQTLTATRTGAVRFMTWNEIDFANQTWTVQGGRQSSKIPHKEAPKRVPLTPAMLAILDAVPRRDDSNYIFWAAGGGALCDATLGKLMHEMHEADLKRGGRGFTDIKTNARIVPHGTRSTFKLWATEKTSYPWELAEAALWHSLGGKVERAYARTDLLEQRREMMEHWELYITGLEALSPNEKRP